MLIGLRGGLEVGCPPQLSKLLLLALICDPSAAAAGFFSSPAASEDLSRVEQKMAMENGEKHSSLV